MSKRNKIIIAGTAFLFALFLTAIVLVVIIAHTPADKLFELIAEKKPRTKSDVRKFIMSAIDTTKPDELEYLYSNTFIMGKNSRVPYIISLIGDEEHWHLFASPESRGPYTNDPFINRLLHKAFDINFYSSAFLNGNTYRIRKY